MAIKRRLTTIERRLIKNLAHSDNMTAFSVSFGTTHNSTLYIFTSCLRNFFSQGFNRAPGKGGNLSYSGDVRHEQAVSSIESIFLRELRSLTRQKEIGG